MLLRDRTGIPVPAELVGSKSVGQLELAKVEAWMKKRPPKGKLKFSAYKCASVALGLERLFEGKCAYCESPYTRTQPVDIEHWRPKSEVHVFKEGKKERKGGYPWLAMVWENLLPSCIDCNRARKQIVYRPNAAGVLEPIVIVQGKANQFPLVDEAQRIKKRQASLSQERPLLLNPCSDDPKQYFVYNDRGVIIPQDQFADTPEAAERREMALASIEVYALNRKGLVDARMERVVLLKARFRLIAALVNLEVNAKDKRSRGLVHDLIDSEVSQLLSLCAPFQPYAQLTRQFVHQFLSGILTA